MTVHGWQNYNRRMDFVLLFWIMLYLTVPGLWAVMLVLGRGWKTRKER